MTTRLTPLLLASLLAVSGGAKTLPRGRAQPPEAAGCEELGPGYVKLAGSDTCVKLGGSVRAEFGVGGAGRSFSPRP